MAQIDDRDRPQEVQNTLVKGNGLRVMPLILQLSAEGGQPIHVARLQCNGLAQM
jgi:hypothetical protein